MTNAESQELDMDWVAEPIRRIAELDREFGCNVLNVPRAALSWRVFGDANEYGFTFVWEYIGSTEQDAWDYYAGLSPVDRLVEGAAALHEAGWTRETICRKLS